MATKAETRDRAATLLGRLKIGQALQHQDKVRIEAAYDEVYEDLKDEGLAIWATTASVPAAVVPHVAALMAWNCLDDYGVSDSRYQRILNKVGRRGETAKSEIRRLVTPEYESLDEPTAY